MQYPAVNFGSNRVGASAALALVAVSLCLGVGSAAWAQPGGLTLMGTDTAAVEYNLDNQNRNENDDDYGVIINHFNLSGTTGDLTASLRVDTFYYFYPPDRDPVPEFDNNIAILERLTARYSLGDWTLVAGDYFSQLGSGIALSLRKLPEVGRDIAIRGGLLSFDNGEHVFSMYGGVTNTINLDTVSNRHIENVNDILAGLTYEMRALEGVNLGTFGQYFEPEERLLDERDLTASAGAYTSINGLADWLSLYLEGDYQYRRLAGIPENGYGGYLTADVTVGDFGILAEGLYLKAYELRGSRNTATNSRFIYNQAPTLERIDQEVFQNTDVLGGRLYTEYYFFDADVLLYANGMVRLNYPNMPAEMLQLHGYAGTEIYTQEGLGHVFLSGGYRSETQDDRQIRSMWHAELDFLLSISPRLSFHLNSINEFRTLEDDHYQRGGALAGVDLTNVGGITLDFGYDTQDRDKQVRNFFLAGIVFWEITNAVKLSVIGGAQRGGIKCINGICRDFPAFTGVRTTLVARF